jgi:DNA invertase Pin-like site-specific DNA recombinase
MAKYGYARVSTIDQDLTIQRNALKAAGCEVIRAEKASGTRRDGRSELQVLMDFVHAGDAVVVTRIDRLARSIKDLQDIVHELKARGVTLQATEQPIDTSTAAGKAFLDMLGVFAEFETNLRRERQLEGVAKAKAKGVYKGRRPTIDAQRVRQMLKDGTGPTAIAAELGITRSSVYRLTRSTPASAPAPPPTMPPSRF